MVLQQMKRKIELGVEDVYLINLHGWILFNIHKWMLSPHVLIALSFGFL